MSDQHHRDAQVRCERLECLQMTICFGYSRIDGARICHECYWHERKAAS